MSRSPNRIDLHHQDDHLTGVVFGQSVDLPLDIPHSDSATSGTYGDLQVTARWTIASNYNTSEQPASLFATFGDDSVELTTTFMFVDDSNPTLVGATVVGYVGGDSVEVQVAPGRKAHQDFFVERVISVERDPNDPHLIYERGRSIGPAPSRSSRRHDRFEKCILEGHVGSTDITLIVRASREKTTVEGTIDGEAVKLTATQSPAREEGIRIKGRWHGAPSLCLLSVACMLYFM